MYFLRWKFEDDVLLPYCEVEYEEESYLDVNLQQKEHHAVTRLRDLSEIFNDISERINKKGFPDLCPPHYKILEEAYPLFYKAKSEKLGVLELDCDKIIGGNWANLPQAECPGYPKARKVWDLLVGYLNMNERLEKTEENIPPIPVFKIKEDYFCREGNHRLYVSRLLGRKTIKANVVELDYTPFK